MFGIYTKEEATNICRIPKELSNNIVTGKKQIIEYIGNHIHRFIRSNNRNCVLGFDGFLGVAWEQIISPLKEFLSRFTEKVEIIDINLCINKSAQIEKLLKKSLESDIHFGYVFEGTLDNFFNITLLTELQKKIELLKKEKTSNPLVVICFGTGSAIAKLRTYYDLLFYVDITREQLLNRFENGTAHVLGRTGNGLSGSKLLKRLHYVDYQILKIHKRYIFKYIDYYIEQNQVDKPKLFPRAVYNRVLSEMSQSPLRLKPIYIMRVWGGQYLKKIRDLPESMTGCSFSLELVAAEQVMRIRIEDTITEIPFLNLVLQQPRNLLGVHCIRKFGVYFPLTSNYDDTYKGGSLAIQVHPDTKYMRKKFNEMMRHDESYYIVKSWPGARTYHGLTDEADLNELYELCAEAEKNKKSFDYNKYINSWSSNSGDLFLLPAGTIHASGENQLVLEMDMDGSKNGTEYTFHLYDYLRTDLDGNLRSIHLDHAFNVIKPHFRKRWVGKYLKQHPRLLRSGKLWAEYLLGKRRDMSYEIHRIEFFRTFEGDTKGKFHVLTLVEGKRALIQCRDNPQRQFEIGFTETVIIPACVGSYLITNLGSNEQCKLTKMQLK
jgi:mannose-6-phosphate isomerase class I